MTIIHGDARRIPLADETVQCVVTSPPYFGLRQYSGLEPSTWGDGWTGMLGLEPTVELFIAHLVEVFREVRRVLRSDGVCWIVIGDSYSDKNLCLIPARLALALQADGWWIRSDVIWAKGVSFCETYSGSVMPESVTDRPTRAHEHVFMLSRGAKYFYDQEAEREDSVAGWKGSSFTDTRDQATKSNLGRRERIESAGRNLRDVWTISPSPSPLKHYAMFPIKLVEPMVKLTSSDKACAQCGKAWEREVEVSLCANQGVGGKRADCPGSVLSPSSVFRTGMSKQKVTLGFRPACSCGCEETTPSLVLDPFCGAGTVGIVCQTLGRRFVGMDASSEYVALARERLDKAVLGKIPVEEQPLDSLPLFVEVNT